MTQRLLVWRSVHPWRWALVFGVVVGGVAMIIEPSWWALFTGLVVVIGVGLSRSRDRKPSDTNSDPRWGGVKLARGVATYVHDHGGTLYVWAEPFGGGLDRVRASTRRPDDIEFVRVEPPTDFELLVERDRDWQRFRLARRWWGLRDGIVADTGYVFGGG